MSHVATVEIEIKDLDALAKACEACGLEFVRDQTTFKWFGSWVKDYHAEDAAYKNGFKPEDYGKCLHAIRVPGKADAYEIGVARRQDGKLGLLFDFWAGGKGLIDKCGQNAGKLTQEYAAQVAMKKAKLQGFSVQRKQLQDGRVQLVCMK
jgi:hypothetical protein